MDEDVNRLPAPPAPSVPEPFGNEALSRRPTAAPSEEALLRRCWRTLPEGDRAAVARWVEATDYRPGYFDALDAPDWAAVRVGDALVARLADARLVQPDLTPEAFMVLVLQKARSSDPSG